jgi:pimeloyl-ACP methyl ester carboxylesterase
MIGSVSRELVLVHGMSHGGWAWELLARRLERDGHRVVAPDLPGHGRRAHERRHASLAAYARAVADAAIQAGFSRATIVGHSMGGAVLPGVAALIPARIARLVFLAAVVPMHGTTTLQGHITPAGRQMMHGLARASDRAIQYPALFEWSRWMGDLPLGDPRVSETLPRLTPQPLRPLTERVNMRAFHALRLPCTYIRCLRDAAVTPPRAAEYAARLGVTPIDMDCAHNPMLSAVDELAKILTTLD